MVRSVLVMDWVCRSIPYEDDVLRLSREININKYLSVILLQRGINSYDTARHFFNPPIDHLYDPYLMYGMREAVDIIAHAIVDHKKILLYGDYDVDGVMSVAMMYNFLSDTYHIRDRLAYTVSDRFTEGYGVSIRNIQKAIGDKVDLIVTFDCGIKDYEAIQLAKDHGITVIVTDHHEVDNTVVHPADVVINPNQNKCHYPFDGLSGCGVGFKLIQALISHYNLPVEIAYGYLDLVALSTACDVVPLVDENRIILYHGLKKINTCPQIGLKALIKVAQIRGEVDYYDMSFKLGPRVNAVGRLQNASIAIDLFTTMNENDVIKLANKVNALNIERKKICTSMTDEALSMMGSSDETVSLLYNEKWHQGVLGIVAARCVESWYKPTIVFTKSSDGLLVGSARSVDGINIHDIISQCSHLLERFGGHECAVGLVLKPENFDNFRHVINRAVSVTMSNKSTCQKLNIDIRIPLRYVTSKFCGVLKRMGPFGEDNTAPVFVSTVCCKWYSVTGPSSVVMAVYHRESIVHTAIIDGIPDLLNVIRSSNMFVMAYTINTSDHTLRTLDLKPCTNQGLIV